MGLQTFNTVQSDPFVEISMCNASSVKNIRAGCFSKFLLSNFNTDVKVSFPDIHSNQSNNNEVIGYVAKRVQDFIPPPYYNDSSRCRRHKVREYFNLVFSDFSFYVWNVFNEFSSLKDATSCLQKPFGSVVFRNRRQTIGIQTYGVIQPLTQMHVYYYSSKRKQRKEIDIFPYGRFILRCYHHRPSSEIDHHCFYWSRLKQIDNENSVRTGSALLCTLLNRYSKSTYVVRLVLRRLRRICISIEKENRYVGSSTSFWTSLKHTMRNHCRDLEHMYCCFDFVFVLILNKRNRWTFENASDAFSNLTKYLGYCGYQCITELDIMAYIQMFQIKERVLPYQMSERQRVSKKHIRMRYNWILYLFFAVQCFFTDSDSWPLLAFLASNLSGSEECRTKLKELGFGKVISNVLQKSHINTPICQKCFKVMDIATDGKPENILSLFTDNFVLKQELRYAMQHFIGNTLICERMVSMMIKLIKADSDAAQWFIS